MSDHRGCARCRRSLARGYYEVNTGGGSAKKCVRCAIIHPALMKKAALTALFVGTVLTSINHLDVILAGGLTTRVAIKVITTYFVPYCVTTWGALTNARRAGSG